MYVCVYISTEMRSECIHVQILPKAANFSWKNDCFGRVVLCCFAFLFCVALPFSASLEVNVHVH